MNLARASYLLHVTNLEIEKKREVELYFLHDDLQHAMSRQRVNGVSVTTRKKSQILSKHFMILAYLPGPVPHLY